MTAAVAIATRRVRQLVEHESRGYGDTDNALRRLESKIGVGFWTLWHLYQRRAKTAEGDICQRIKCGYVAYCEQKVGSILADLEVEKAIDPDADFEDLATAARDLAAQIATRKASRLNSRGRG